MELLGWEWCWELDFSVILSFFGLFADSGTLCDATLIEVHGYA